MPPQQPQKLGQLPREVWPFDQHHVIPDVHIEDVGEELSSSPTAVGAGDNAPKPTHSDAFWPSEADG